MTTFDPVLRDGEVSGPQNKRLLDYLRDTSGHSITPLESWELLGIYRLGARVWDLKRAGIVIRSELVEVRNQFGETCRVARYTLETNDAP